MRENAKGKKIKRKLYCTSLKVDAVRVYEGTVRLRGLTYTCICYFKFILFFNIKIITNIYVDFK